MISVVYFILLLTVSFAVGEETTPEPVGACCLGQGVCVELTSEECVQAGGLFVGGECVAPVGDLSPCQKRPGVYDRGDSDRAD